MPHLHVGCSALTTLSPPAVSAYCTSRPGTTVRRSLAAREQEGLG
jgi:hypothetical protein